MMTDLLLAAAYDPSRDLRVLIGVPVAVALITGGAGIVVALLTSSRQARIAAADRVAADEREQRSRDAASDREHRAQESEQRRERADVHDAIVEEILAFSRESGAAGNRKADTRLVAKALSGILTHLGATQVYYSALGVLNAAQTINALGTRMRTISILQLELDDWFVGHRDEAAVLDKLKKLKAAAEVDAAKEQKQA